MYVHPGSWTFGFFAQFFAIRNEGAVIICI